MRIFIFIGITLFLFSHFFSQDNKDKKKSKEEQVPENIHVFKQNFMIRPRFVLPSVWFNVSGRLVNDANSFTWKPAMPRVVGLSMKIKKVFISFAVKIPTSDNYKNKYGNTKSRNINLNIQGRTLLWTLFYRDYLGFYLFEPQKHYPKWHKDSSEYPKLDNLRIFEAGINFGLNFNKKFSLNAAFAQSERQKKSAGSFLLFVSERYQRIEGDTNMVPFPLIEHYPSTNQFSYGNFISTIFSMGFAYQFVKNKLHFTPLIHAGAGLQYQRFYQRTIGERTKFNFPTYFNFKSQLGYNADHFFVNFIYSLEFNSIPISESRIRIVHNWIEMGLGIRI
ncbi:MAG: DUF4421 family protein [Flavobacteriia bacterium]|nr:DUF4421 family protein [Flavobacteriia bacterium]